MPPVMTAEKAGLILTVSNRGPVEFGRNAHGDVVAEPGRGGLSTALYAAAQAGIAPMVWLSSPLTPVDREIADGDCDASGLESLPGLARFVVTDPAAYDFFYGTFANQVLWFLQHDVPWPDDLTSARRFEAWEQGYQVINQTFADAVVRELDTGDYRAVMFHDYLFYSAPRMVRERRPHAFLQHFLHIPWPKPSVWARLEPELVRQVCAGMLGNDSIVFQTPDDARNFLLTAGAVLPDAHIDVVHGTARFEGRISRAWANPISVDPQELASAAASRDFARYRYLLRGDSRLKTIVRVDRLDLTKNVYRGFEAYEMLLEHHPELRGRVYFLALLVPTKTDIPAYQRYQDDTRALAESINKRFATRNWKPIRLLFEHNRLQALAAMSLYDVLLVNPLADGMNLVAKEAPLLNRHEGVLVLSKKAGAWAELADGAIGIDPEDVEGTAEALLRALTMEPIERYRRWTRIRDSIRDHDLRAWFRALVDDIERFAPVPNSTAA